MTRVLLLIGLASLISTPDVAALSLQLPDSVQVRQARALRHQAIDVLERRGPADLALAQLTRAALLDPKEDETWQALEQGSVQLTAEPSGWRRKLASWRLVFTRRWETFGAQASATVRKLRVEAPIWWQAHGSDRGTWGAFSLLALLVGCVAAWAVRPPTTATRVSRTARASAKARKSTPSGDPASTPGVSTAARTRPGVSADELALRAYLEQQDESSGGSAESGILARA